MTKAVSVVFLLLQMTVLQLDAQTDGRTADQHATEVTIETKDGVRLYADLYECGDGQSAPLIMLFHQGGGDARGEYAPLAPKLATQGYNLLAVDLRNGGTRLGGENRTVANLVGKQYSYCEVYPDLEATLDYAIENGLDGPRIAWGSSFSASLVFQLAAKRGDDLSGILAFSPASGGPMASCKAELFADQVKIPVLAFRPRSEMSVPSVQSQIEHFQKHGIDTYVAENGVHGSSMLNEQRTKGDTSDHWERVFQFLEKCTADSNK